MDRTTRYYFCPEILLIKPYQFKSGIEESGASWKIVSEDLNTITELNFSTTQKSARDRYRLLIEKQKKKQRNDIKSSRTVSEDKEIDILLQIL